MLKEIAGDISLKMPGSPDYKQKIIDLGWHTETIVAKNTITFRVMNGKRIFWHKVSKAELEANYYPEVVKNLIWHGLYEEILKQL